MAASFQRARVLLQSRDSVRWRSKDGVTYERNIDAVETFYLANSSNNARSGRRNLDITVSAKLHVDSEYDTDIRHVRSAWLALRQRHPAIASLVHGSKRIYKRLQAENIQSWLNQTLVTITEEDQLTPELLDSLPAADTPVLYFLPESMTFALRTPHCFMDSLGSIMLLNDFLHELNETTAGITDVDEPLGERPEELACSFKDAASPPSASISQLARLWSLRRRWLRNYPTIGVVPDQESPQSNLSTWRELEYISSSTRDLVAKAKKHKMSVTHVLHAGVAFATKEYGPFTLTRNYNSFITLDQRRRRQDKSVSLNDTVSAQHAMWPVSVRVTSFWKTAGEFKQAYQDVINDPDFPALVEPVFAEVFPSPPSDCPTFSSAPILGSCGRIDKFLESSFGGFIVEDFSLATECSGEEVVVVAWTYKGKLRIRAMFNEGYHSPKSIERYLQLVQKALRDGLGVSPTGD
ncbi:hypothetical protein BDV19DRAFT_383493 [Aspergillus venezuelensis]